MARIPKNKFDGSVSVYCVELTVYCGKFKYSIVASKLKSDGYSCAIIAEVEANPFLGCKRLFWKFFCVFVVRDRSYRFNIWELCMQPASERGGHCPNGWGISSFESASLLYDYKMSFNQCCTKRL